MTTQTKENQSKAILNEWKTSPAVRAEFGNDMTKFILHREAEMEWMSPAVQKEFQGNFDSFLAYKTGKNSDRIKIKSESSAAS
jgi:hypothetical protein